MRGVRKGEVFGTDRRGAGQLLPPQVTSKPGGEAVRPSPPPACARWGPAAAALRCAASAATPPPWPPSPRRKADEETKERAQKAKAELVGKQQASLANAAVAATLGGKGKGKLSKWDKWAAAGPAAAAGGEEAGGAPAAGGKGKKGGGGKKGGKKGGAAPPDAGGATSEGEAVAGAKVRPAAMCPRASVPLWDNQINCCPSKSIVLIIVESRSVDDAMPWCSLPRAVRAALATHLVAPALVPAYQVGPHAVHKCVAPHCLCCRRLVPRPARHAGAA